jgi:hypothetical protein
MARRTFFSFHYKPDVWRAWNVRNCWTIRPNGEEDAGFFDSSVFEAAERQNPEALKTFLRNGLENTSVTCVLTGLSTWSRRWVRYEIARSIIKGNGILAVHIYGVKDKSGEISQKGPNPLDNIGLYRTQSGVLLAEWQKDKWVQYMDYKLAIPESQLWFAAPSTNNVVPLSRHCRTYDFTEQNGRQNIASWIEEAAVLAGR